MNAITYLHTFEEQASNLRENITKTFLYKTNMQNLTLYTKSFSNHIR